MSLTGFCLRRPVTTVMVILFIVLFGLISLIGLPQELFPPISYPQLTVVTVYANAAPEEIETLITKPVEEAVGTVSGLKQIKSISKEGISLVMAEFGWNENMDFASLKVREKIDLIKERLPRESGEPLVMKYNPFERPVMMLSITGKRSSAEVREITRRIIKDELEKVEGVASASISGGREREINVLIDQGRLNAMNVPIMDVVNTITNANLNYPAGTIKESFYEYLIRTLGEFEHVDEIQHIPVKKHEEDPQAQFKDDQRKIAGWPDIVLLSDVAQVHDTFKDRTSFSRYKGNENISVSVQKQAQVNTLQVVNRLKKAIKIIEEEVPSDIKVHVVSDQSKFIRDSINGVRDTAVQGGILVFLVLFLFLRNVKTSVIVTFSMPISIIAVFVCMFFFDISLNMMSLGGLVLGIGMLVDSAIVVLENITRHREEFAKGAYEASVEGAEEVTNAIVASTLTTVAVFFPMVFVAGIAGQIFKQLAFTVIFSLIASLLVAVSLIPLLASKVKTIKKQTGNSSYILKFEVFLRKMLNKPFLTTLLIIGLIIASFAALATIDKELMPKMDQGEFLLKINLPAGTRLEVADREVKKIEKIIMDIPEVKDLSLIIGSTIGKGAEDVLQRLESHESEIIIRLKKNRKRDTKSVVQHVKAKIKALKLNNVKVEYVLNESIFSGAVEGSSPVVVEVKGKDISQMINIVKSIQKFLKKIDGIYGIKSDMPERSPEAKIFIDKDKAATYQMSVVDIAQATQVALKGYIASELKEKGQEIDIRVRLHESHRDDFDKLSRIEMTSASGIKVPLATFVKFEIGKGPSEIKRNDQERTILVTANVFGRALKDIFADIDYQISKLDIDDDYTVKLAGESEEMKQSFDSLMGALILSILLVYMIMAAQFESLWQPLIIMVTVPLSLIGVVFALYITGTSVNVIVFLGIIMLAGIVVNNGIVLIDYINVLRAKGMEVYDAVIEASKARLRPILMTAMTTVLGLLPMAIAKGEGAELRSPLAISVMGGLFVTTFLSLLVIPAIYLATNNLRLKLFKR